MEKINLKTTKRVEFFDITDNVRQVISNNKVKDGICILYCPHTTAGLSINENADPSVKKDIINTLNKLIPENAGYAHSEGNSDSHIKSSLLGTTLTLFVEFGQLKLGTWQGIYFAEFDGPRARNLWLKFMPDS